MSFQNLFKSLYAPRPSLNQLITCRYLSLAKRHFDYGQRGQSWGHQIAMGMVNAIGVRVIKSVHITCVLCIGRWAELAIMAPPLSLTKGCWLAAERVDCSPNIACQMMMMISSFQLKHETFLLFPILEVRETERYRSWRSTIQLAFWWVMGYAHFHCMLMSQSLTISSTEMKFKTQNSNT